MIESDKLILESFAKTIVNFKHMFDFDTTIALIIVALLINVALLRSD